MLKIEESLEGHQEVEFRGSVESFDEQPGGLTDDGMFACNSPDNVDERDKGVEPPSVFDCFDDGEDADV